MTDAKGGKGGPRTKSRHGAPQPYSEAELRFHQAIHEADARTKVSLARWKSISTICVSGSAVATAYFARPETPAGLPAWCWIVMSVSATLALVFCYLWWQEAKRNGSLIERLSPFLKQHELKHDPNRSSSQLTPRGETNAKDAKE